MSDHVARTALSRMHMKEAYLSPMYAGAGFAADMQMLSAANPDDQQKAFLARRAEMCAAFGINSASDQRKPFAYADGVAFIPVWGALLNRYSYSSGYATGYNFIRAQLNYALEDDDVKMIVFDVNSYGGEAAGCFELCAEIRASRSIKPSMAMVDSNAYSAGYAVASSASKVYAIPSAGVANIGVIMMHVDMSKMLKDWGLVVTMMYEGDRKADFNPYEALSDEAKADAKASIHKSYEKFVAVAAENMDIDPQKIRDTQSRGYRAEEAVALGLIHGTASPASALSAFQDELSGSDSQLKKDDQMTIEATKPGEQQAGAATPADAEKARQEGAQAERTRVKAIMGCDEAKGRQTLATHIAMETAMSPEDATKMLKASPLEKAATEEKAPVDEKKPGEGAAKTPTQFEQAMNNEGGPGIGGEGGGSATEKATNSDFAAVMASHKAATGTDLVKQAGK